MSAQIHDATEASEKITIEFGSETGQPDVYVAETYVDRWGTERAVLKGDTYNAKEAIKTDWEQTHYKFDGNRKEWIVDADDDSLEVIEQSLAEDGFSFDANAGDTEITESFADLLAVADEDDDIRVVYAKKNGNGNAEKEGRIFDVRRPGDTDVFGSPETPCIALEREDGGPLRIKEDDSGKVSLWSSGYYPYMGAVESVELVSSGSP